MMFIIAEKQHYDVYLQSYSLISVFLAFYMGYNIFNSIEISLYLFVFLYSLRYIAELIISYQLTIKLEGDI